MKAIVVTPYYYPKIGGLENYARQLGIALKNLKQWEIVVITSGEFTLGVRQESIDGMKLFRLGRWIKLSNTPLSPLWPFQIKKILKMEKPDLIIAHTPVPMMADSAALASGKIPFVIVYHASTLLKDGSTIFNLFANAYSVVESFTLKKAEKIFVVSNFVKKQMPGKLQDKVLVVPNSVWKSEISTRKHQPNDANLLFIGSLDKTHSWKGLSQVIESLSIYKRAFGSRITLKIMGAGNNLSEYEALVKRLGLSKNVKFIGSKSGHEKDKLISEATAIIIYPTTSNDAFPTVLLEAWAKGVPVICSDIGPLSTLIQDTKNGYLVEPSSPTALANKLNEIIRLKKSTRQTVVEYAASRTASEYTWENQAVVFSKAAKGVIR